MTLPQNTQMVPIDYAKALNQEQLDVVLHGDGPCRHPDRHGHQHVRAVQRPASGDFDPGRADLRRPYGL